MTPSESTDIVNARAREALALAAAAVLGQNMPVRYRGDGQAVPETAEVWARVSKLSAGGGAASLGGASRRNQEIGIVIIEFYARRTKPENYRHIQSIADIVKQSFVRRSGPMVFTQQHVHDTPQEDAFWRVNFQCDYNVSQVY